MTEAESILKSMNDGEVVKEYFFANAFAPPLSQKEREWLDACNSEADLRGLI